MVFPKIVLDRLPTAFAYIKVALSYIREAGAYVGIPALLLSMISLYYTQMASSERVEARKAFVHVLDLKVSDPYGPSPVLYYTLLKTGADQIDDLEISFNDFIMAGGKPVVGADLTPTISIGPLITDMRRYFQKQISKENFKGLVAVGVKFVSRGSHQQRRSFLMFTTFRPGLSKEQGGAGEYTADYITGPGFPKAQ